jgi:hypothetical protein
VRGATLERFNAETVRQLGMAADIRPDEAQLQELATALGALVGAIEGCEALNLGDHEPANRFELGEGKPDAQL